MPKPGKRCEAARDSVRNSEIEGCYPAFAESDQKDRSHKDCQKQDDHCGNRHVPTTFRAYRMAADARSTTFAGASEIKATPMTTSTADPIRNPVRWLGISRPSIDIATACAKLDHAAKAIRPIRRWIPHCDEQENAERDIEAKHHRIASIRISRMQ